MNTINLHDFAASLSFGRKFMWFPSWNDSYDLIPKLFFWFHPLPPPHCIDHCYVFEPFKCHFCLPPILFMKILLIFLDPAQMWVLSTWQCSLFFFSRILALLYYVVIICLAAFLTLDWGIIHSTQSNACQISTKNINDKYKMLSEGMSDGVATEKRKWKQSILWIIWVV